MAAKLLFSRKVFILVSTLLIVRFQNMETMMVVIILFWGLAFWIISGLKGLIRS